MSLNLHGGDKHAMQVENISPILCEAHGVEAREDRPCLFLRGVLSPEECKELITFSETKHDQVNIRRHVSLVGGLTRQARLKDVALYPDRLASREWGSAPNSSTLTKHSLQRSGPDPPTHT